MNAEKNQAIVRDVMERGFGQGELSVIDKYHATDGVDHQEPLGTDFVAHLKDTITSLRMAFPDLHFEIHDMIAEGDMVAFRSTMTGTHLGQLHAGPTRQIPATGRKVSVPHMHFVRIVNGKTTDLWHLWNTPMMMQQLGIVAEERPNMPR
jgi:predicted ester cyclase